MTKRKRETAKSLIIKSNVLNGKITKAKNSETKLNLPRTPLGGLQLKTLRELPNFTTPFLMKCRPTCTSTPMDMSSNPTESKPNEVSRFGRQIKYNEKYTEWSAPRSPLSPILVDISNRTASNGKNANKNNSSVEYVVEHVNKKNLSLAPRKSERNSQKTKVSSVLPLSSEGNTKRLMKDLNNVPSSKRIKVSDENDPPKGATRLTKKRLYGTRKMTVSPDNAALPEPLEHTENGVRRVSRFSFNSQNRAITDVPPIDRYSANLGTSRLRKTSHSQDLTLVKHLRADWSSTSFEETPTQVQRNRNSNIQRQPLGIAKRRLTTLVEVTMDETTDYTTNSHLPPSATKEKADEDAYSSSEEFEKDCEKENSCKRAPTWKDLSNKTLELASHSTKSVAQQLSLRSKENGKVVPEPLNISHCDAFDNNNKLRTAKIKIGRSKEISGILTSKAAADCVPNPLTISTSDHYGDKSDIKSLEVVSNEAPKVRIRRSKVISETLELNSKPDSAPQTNHSDPVTISTSEPSSGLRAEVRVLRTRLISKNPTPASKKNNETPVPESITINAAEPSMLRNSAHDCGLGSIPAVDAKENGNKSNNSSDGLTVTKAAVSSTSRSQNLLNRSDLIDQILSSSADCNGDEEIVSSNNLNNSNCSSNLNNANYSRRIFQSRVDTTIGVPKTVEKPKLVKGSKSSGTKKKNDSVYEFLSQSSSDSADPVADVIQKMIDSGKVIVAKRKKGTGKPIVPRQKRKVPMKKKLRNANDVLAKPMPLLKPQPLGEGVTNRVQFDDDFHFDDGGDNVSEEGYNRDQRGFSELARSAMLKQAGKNDVTPQRKMITDKKKLLEMAQKIVGKSTSVRPSAVSSPITAPLSPIAGSSSPWRVEDDNLPNTFYFSRNSDNLPSFSSDYIPSTPAKNKSKSTSSFSSNDSNMENVAPPAQTANTNRTQSSLNTRRALSYRSPLKAINIIDVINLPPLAVNNNTGMETNKENTRKDKSDSSNASKTSLFGFEEMIQDDDDNITDVTVDQSAIGNMQNLKLKLQGLKRLRPQNPVATSSKNYHIKPVFDNKKPKQKTIQQMLCSTMIERQRQSEMHESCDISNLFKDPEPETTFDESLSRRTYVKPFKKRRKIRNNFVLFMDSDVSDDEEADQNYAAKSKKRQRKDPKVHVELNKFVDEFNEMCKEVSQYELVVE